MDYTISGAEMYFKMTSDTKFLTVPLGDDLKAVLRLQAALHGHSMEEEVRCILRQALCGETYGLGTQIHQRFAVIGGVELALPERTELPRSPKFEP